MRQMLKVYCCCRPGSGKGRGRDLGPSGEGDTQRRGVGVGSVASGGTKSSHGGFPGGLPP